MWTSELQISQHKFRSTQKIMLICSICPQYYRMTTWAHSDKSISKDGMINRFFITGQTETQTQTNKSTKQNLNYYRKQNLIKEDTRGMTLT